VWQLKAESRNAEIMFALFAAKLICGNSCNPCRNFLGASKQSIDDNIPASCRAEVGRRRVSFSECQLLICENSSASLG
jgi:hypothetical protein